MKRGLARAAIACGVLVVLGVVAACAGWWRVSVARQAETRMFGQLRALEAERAQARKTAVVRRQLEKRWRALRTDGFFEPPKYAPRLAWTALLRRLQAREGIPVLHAQWRAHAPDADGEEAGKWLRHRAGTLELECSHELELPALLRELRAASPALVLVRECSMWWNAERREDTGSGQNLLARCALEWVTGAVPSADDGAEQMP
ncbi:MAG: hypothetical protein LBO79_09480 [Zoogloeaceae bacterium]|nr:hypothetical protein [Zoogloeaceae bacterium]